MFSLHTNKSTMRFLISNIIFLLFSTASFSQNGLIEGKITDAKTGNPISAVSIQVLGTKITKVSNIDGQFSINLPINKIYQLQFSSVGYAGKILDSVITETDKVNYLNITLSASTKIEGEVIIRSNPKKESVASLIAVQKNTSVVAQVISAEAIRRSPDKNTGEILKRVSGLSLQEGKYVVVRGLADRYNQAMLNGVLLSSTEPDRKTFSFDIFPSGMIENIVINKAFIPELPGEWAGGLIQVNTKDVPSKNFFSLQVGTGFNTATAGKEFYAYKGGKTDFLGYDDGSRGLPNTLPTKSAFNNILDKAEKNKYATLFSNVWTANKTNPEADKNIQLSGGFTKNLGGGKKLAAILALNYRNVYRRNSFANQIGSVNDNIPDIDASYENNKYAKEILAGALANITLQIGSNSKISLKNIINVNTTNYTTLRTGIDFAASNEYVKATELAFKANTFFNTQLTGDHNIKKYNAKLHWFGSFNILDQYVPDQRRVQYVKQNINDPYTLQQATNSSQKSGSRYFGVLNDYNYTAGVDFAKTFKAFKLNQTFKTGYFFQLKDRLFDARPFAIYLPNANAALSSLPQDQVYAAANFGNGNDNKFAINQLYNPNFRYIANAYLNAGFLQLDNMFTPKVRLVWGLRVENFDQLVGSKDKKDPRYVQSTTTDFLPGANFTYKLNTKTNIRVSGSQTIIRPEFRELSNFQFYDFDLSATVAGNPNLVRTKVTNFDLRYEAYPRSGELFTVGLFYKYFKNPIEAFANQGSFNFLNADKATSYGIEIEGRKKLDFINDGLKNFTLQTNLSYIYNRVKSEGRKGLDRPMQGQSPYLINATLQYDVEKYGITTTALFNRIGRRILLVGGDAGLAPVWENPRSVIDFQIAKKVSKNKGEVKLNVSDILNQQAIFYYKAKDEKYLSTDPFFKKIKAGTNFSLSFSYNF